MNRFCIVAVMIIGFIALPVHSAIAANDKEWERLEGQVRELVNSNSISKTEIDAFENIMYLGRQEQTEPAIKALTSFLKDNRNTALRQTAREVFAELIRQRKDRAEFGAGRAGEGVVCAMEMKACPNGALVERVGPECRFAACPD